MKPGEAQALFQSGQIALAMGDLAAARRRHDEALAIRQRIGETRTTLESRVALAELAFEEGRVAEAARAAQQLLEELRTAPEGPLQTAIRVLLVRAQLAGSDTKSAEATLFLAQRLAASTERIELKRMLSMAEAEVDVARGRPARARERLTELCPMLRAAGMPLAELECRVARLRIDRAAGRSSVRADAAALEKEARGRRAGLVLRRLQAL